MCYFFFSAVLCCCLAISKWRMIFNSLLTFGKLLVFHQSFNFETLLVYLIQICRRIFSWFSSNSSFGMNHPSLFCLVITIAIENWLDKWRCRCRKTDSYKEWMDWKQNKNLSLFWNVWQRTGRIMRPIYGSDTLSKNRHSLENKSDFNACKINNSK